MTYARTSPTAISGYGAPLSLVITADGHSFTYSDTVEVIVTLTASSTDAPTGPDAYGYYAYDVTDGAYGPAPTFEWTDIAPPGPGALVTEITDADRRIVERLAPRLKREGLYFVGIDVIGGYLTEVNITSPTGVQEINALEGSCLEARIIDWVEDRLRERDERLGRSGRE